jgi:hypothetical protein
LQKKAPIALESLDAAIKPPRADVPDDPGSNEASLALGDENRPRRMKRRGKD